MEPQLIKSFIKRLFKPNPISFLMDLSVYRLGMTVKPVTESKEIKWGEITQMIPITGFARKLPFDSKKQKEVECIPTISRLIKEKRLIAYQYNELQFENMLGSQGLRNVKGDLFQDIDFEQVEPAIDRSYLGGMTLSQCVDRKDFIRFCDFLLSLEPEKIINFEEVRSLLPEFQRANLKNLDRFKDICEHLPRKHFPDVFHLWTAETNGLDYFLTNDTKFINVMTKTKQIDLPTPPITPSGLLNILRVKKRDPMPIEDYNFHNLFEGS